MLGTPILVLQTPERGAFIKLTPCADNHIQFCAFRVQTLLTVQISQIICHFAVVV